MNDGTRYDNEDGIPWTMIAILTATGFARLLEKLRFAVSPTDPVTYLAVTALLAAVILAALAFPARRAASVNPVNALRYE